MSEKPRDEYFMEQALGEAGSALEQGEFPVGCVFVLGEEIVARGHRQNSGEGSRNEIDHAEIVTLHSLLREQPEIDTASVSVYSTMEPCLMCYSTMLLSGIRRFVWAYEDVMGGGTNLPLYMLNQLYAGMTVELVDNVMRRESLQLFQRFFTEYPYWQDSLLSRYTMAQPL